MKITIEQLTALKAEIVRQGWTDNANPDHRLKVRLAIQATFAPGDYVLKADTAARKLALGLALFTYDQNGLGYKGIKSEVLARCEYLNRIAVVHWFKHKNDQSDMTYNKKRAEHKSACGGWLYSRTTTDLDEIRAEYEASGEYIVWDYDHVPVPGRKNDHPISVHIACTWKQFFKYLDTYPLGYRTFFKYNAIKSAQEGRAVYEMNTLWNSKKKIIFLESAEF